ncbi:MAG: carboxylating nicotinate-nucleotide diphosphorylase [Nitrospira sp.]|nr:carboxylating nicotinate-nucleotide diphosphorylase [Nitrospira sp.]
MSSAPLPPFELESLVAAALKEDAPHGDVTTRVLLEPSLQAQAHVVAKQNLTLAGVAVLHTVYRVLDPAVVVTSTFDDGATLEEGQTFAIVQGPAHSILGGERIALNFLQRLSGIATLTARFKAEIRQYPTVLLDTRKTIPGLRRLEKWAVALGGGTNHRMTLSDGVLIKDNHLVLLEAQGTTIREACRKARGRVSRQFRICVEVENLKHVIEALDGGADVLLLDNMPPALVQEAVDLVKGKAHVEVSGGITLENVREYAATGVDSISIGALTHSAPAVDISLDVLPTSAQ